jgi:glycosyltransferase involved in cell wall biosynthesis
MRVLYSFPHRIGTGRICTTAWYQVVGTAGAGVDIVAAVGSVAKALPDDVKTIEMLARGRIKIPYRALGRMRALALHDRLTARWLRHHHREIDLVHLWPCGALATISVAREYGIPTVLERPNAYTRFAYDVVKRESERLGIELPPDHEHAYNASVLAREEAEFAATDSLLCPSEFTARTFRDAGYPDEKLLRHFYGVDTALFHPNDAPPERPFTAMFVGVAAVRKGLHFALEAWHRSSASSDGRFVIAGAVLPEYRRVLEPLLDHPSVTVLGHSDSIPELIRNAHVLMLPSIEEGFGLVCTEAMASGCVPLVSEACTDLCRDGVNALVHPVADVDRLAEQLSLVARDEGLRRRLRDAGLACRDSISWEAAGEQLAAVYEEAAAPRVRARSLVRSGFNS